MIIAQISVGKEESYIVSAGVANRSFYFLCWRFLLPLTDVHIQLSEMSSSESVCGERTKGGGSKQRFFVLVLPLPLPSRD